MEQLSVRVRILLAGIFLLGLTEATAYANLYIRFDFTVIILIMFIGTLLAAGFLFSPQNK